MQCNINPAALARNTLPGRDLPLVSLGTTAYVVIRNPRLDIGFKAVSILG